MTNVLPTHLRHRGGLLVLILASAAAYQCGYSSSAANYDLSALSKLQPSFTVQDRVQTAEQNYAYTFGVCKNVDAPANCHNKDGSLRVRHSTAPAWQTRTDESLATTSDASQLTCKYLGSPDESTHEWSVDAEDPSKGVKLTYTDGQHCTSGARRKFGLNFKCAPKTVEKIEELVIDESAHCEYEINVDSEYACPTECGLAATGSVCAAHGICGFDSTLKKAKCFCNSGRTGEHCTDTVAEASDGLGAVIGLLVFITILLVALVAALVGLWRFLQVRRLGDMYSSLHTDPRTIPQDNYETSLQNSYEETSFDLERVDVSEPEVIEMNPQAMYSTDMASMAPQL